MSDQLHASWLAWLTANGFTLEEQFARSQYWGRAWGHSSGYGFPHVEHRTL